MNFTKKPARYGWRFELWIVPACLLASVVTMGPGVEAQAQDPAGDKQALVALYNATNGRNWKKNDNWLSNKPVADWHGVTVSDGRVTGLSLGDNRLTGTIPPELGNLASLKQLVLSNNQLTGTIPSELTRMRSVRYFYFNLNSGLCIQDDAAIRTWLAGVENVLGADCSPSVTLTVEPTTMVEGADADVTVTATRTQVTNEATVILTLGGSAREDMDYVFSGEQEITIPAYKATGTATLTFEPAADDLEEGNETILVEAGIDDQVEGSATITLIDVDTGEPFPTRNESFVPVILSAAGRNNSFFTSELTLTSRGTATANLTYTYTAHRGGGSGVAGDRLGPGEQKIIPDAIEYLKTLDTPIPDAGDRIGTLRIALGDLSAPDAAITVRTTTPVLEGRAGLAYPAISAEAGFDEAVYLCGLRQNEQDRSNVAFQNMGESEDGAITLRTTVFSGAVDGGEPRVLQDVTLAPGGFHQYSGPLEKAGFTQGYARVERVSGKAPFYAYGVINDQVNSDGSFVFAVQEGSLAGIMGQTLPVIVETDVFTSELMVTNFSNAPKTVTFRFSAEAVQTPDNTAVVEWTFRPGQQVMVPNIVEMMRHMGTPGIGPSGQTFAGALFATVIEGDMSGIAIGARTVSAGGSGQYGVFYNAVPYGEAFVDSAWVDALQQNEHNRSNLALVNTGEVDASPSVFQLDIYDGKTGMLANTVTGLRVADGGWRQINSILARYAPETAQGYLRVTKVSGNNPFLAYGVINDGRAPGQRSGDGAYLAARK